MCDRKNGLINHKGKNVKFDYCTKDGTGYVDFQSATKGTNPSWFIYNVCRCCDYCDKEVNKKLKKMLVELR